MKVAQALMQQDLAHLAMLINSKTASDVERALNASTLSIDDFMAKILDGSVIIPSNTGTFKSALNNTFLPITL